MPLKLLAITSKADEAAIRDYGLYVEAYTRLDDPRALAVADGVIVSELVFDPAPLRSLLGLA